MESLPDKLAGEWRRVQCNDRKKVTTGELSHLSCGMRLGIARRVEKLIQSADRSFQNEVTIMTVLQMLFDLAFNRSGKPAL
jgi:hypothetical protein